jgi:hypothetical protein
LYQNAHASDSEADLAEFFAEMPVAPQPEVLTQAPATGHEPTSERENPIHKKKKFAGWGPYTKNFKLICKALAFDGRAAELTEIAERQIGLHPECLACDPLFKILAKTCRPAKIKKAKTKKKSNQNEVSEEAEAPQEPTPIPTPVPVILQREPNGTLQVALQLLQERLEEDPKRVVAGQEALYVLTQIFSKPKTEAAPFGKTDYFQAFSELLVASDTTPIPVEKKQGEMDDIKGLGPDNLHIGVAAPTNVDELFN